MISEDAFRELVNQDVRGQTTPKQIEPLQENDETCRRWLTTLRLMISEVESDTEVRDAQNKPYADSAILVEREQWARHLIWKRKSQKFISACRARVLVAEEALRRVSGLTEMADALLADAAKGLGDVPPGTGLADAAVREKWLARYREYEIRRFGQLPRK